MDVVNATSQHGYARHNIVEMHRKGSETRAEQHGYQQPASPCSHQKNLMQEVMKGESDHLLKLKIIGASPIKREAT